MVTRMTSYSTDVRAVHLLTNAAWFGGSLMGAVALNPAAQEGDTGRERAQISDTGWTRWGPVQGGAIALHLLSGLAIVADNRRRALLHPPSSAAVVAKTALTGAALAATGAAYLNGARLGERSWLGRATPTVSVRRRRWRSGCGGCSGRRPLQPPGCSSSTPTSVSSSAGRPGCSTVRRKGQAADERAFRLRVRRELPPACPAFRDHARAGIRDGHLH